MHLSLYTLAYLGSPPQKKPFLLIILTYSEIFLSGKFLTQQIYSSNYFVGFITILVIEKIPFWRNLILNHFDSLVGKKAGITSRKGKIKVNNLNCTFYILINSMYCSQTYHPALKELCLLQEITLLQHELSQFQKFSRRPLWA